LPPEDYRQVLIEGEEEGKTEVVGFSEAEKEEQKREQVVEASEQDCFAWVVALYR
jgi:hypothetical protein